MLLNGGGGSRSALRPRVSANDENAVVGGASKGLGLGSATCKTPGGGGSKNTNKPTVRLALGPAKSLDVNGLGGGGGGGGIVAKTPGPSHARRRAFGDISNRKAGRGPGNPNAAGAGAKTPKAVSFQSNLFDPPPAKTPGGGLGNGGGGKSTKKQGLQQQRTPFASRNANANANTHTSTNPNRSVSFEPSSSPAIKLPSNAVMPMSSRKEMASSSSSSVVPVPRTTSVVQGQIIDEDDGGGSVSSVELPAGGRIWDPSEFFGDDDSYDLAAKIAAVNTSLDDDPSFVMPTFPSKAAAASAAGTDADDRLLAKELEELEKEDYETLDHLLNGFVPADDDGYGEDDLLSGLTPSLDDHDDGLGLLDDLDDLALA